jgi:transcriptional regulator with XRE-family HTH domain
MDKTTGAVLALRKKLGDTQQQFAHRLGLAIATVVRYESTRAPKGKALAALAEVATQNGCTAEAATLSAALAEELGSWSTGGLNLNIEPHTDTERLWVSATLAVLRNPQYTHLVPKLTALLAEPAAMSIEILRQHFQVKKTRTELERLIRLKVEPDIIAKELELPIEAVKNYVNFTAFHESLQQALKRHESTATRKDNKK